MLPFSEMVKEFLKMTLLIARGVASGNWQTPGAGIDPSGVTTNAIWPTIPQERFAAVENVFGQWENSGTHTIMYAIDNEVHHRGQGFVYLRALNIEPPPFWER
jgi:hypothetical protein